MCTTSGTEYFITTIFILLSFFSTMSTTSSTEYFMRAISLLHEGGSAACCKVWEDKKLTGRTSAVTTTQKSQQELYTELETIKIQKCGKKVGLKKWLYPNQVDLVFPANNMTDVSKWDVTLHANLLLQPEITSIKTSPQLQKFDFDDPNVCLQSHLQLGDWIFYLREARNLLIHSPPGSIDTIKFENIWKTIISSF